MKLKVKNYIYAGLDFIFDKDNNPWFLEANSVPRTFVEFKQLYGQSIPIKKLAGIINKSGKNFCILPPKNERLFKTDMPFLLNEFNRYLNTDIHICLSEGKGKTLKDDKGMLIRPDSIFRCLTSFKISTDFEDSGILVINPQSLSRITANKLYTLKLLAENPYLNIPKTFLIEKTEDAKKILNENPDFFQKGFVIKPLRGTGGKGVLAFSKDDKPPLIRSQQLLEQRKSIEYILG